MACRSTSHISTLHDFQHNPEPFQHETEFKRACSLLDDTVTAETCLGSALQKNCEASKGSNKSTLIDSSDCESDEDETFQPRESWKLLGRRYMERMTKAKAELYGVAERYVTDLERMNKLITIETVAERAETKSLESKLWKNLACASRFPGLPTHRRWNSFGCASDAMPAKRPPDASRHSVRKEFGGNKNFANSDSVFVFLRTQHADAEVQRIQADLDYLSAATPQITSNLNNAVGSTNLDIPTMVRMPNKLSSPKTL